MHFMIRIIEVTGKAWICSAVVRESRHFRRPGSRLHVTHHQTCVKFPNLLRCDRNNKPGRK